MTVAQLRALPITIDPEILGGTPVFTGTRVPVRTIFDYLADGCSLDEFLENFPSVARKDAVAILKSQSLISPKTAVEAAIDSGEQK
jgi:uncharacterized protein (DUF433 family)